jgi:DNA-3-methyladenine glycosylase
MEAIQKKGDFSTSNFYPRLDETFFCRDVLEVAPGLIGKTLVRKSSVGDFQRYKITETEAYRGEEDLACHASRGRTARTEVMYGPGGRIYIYLIYGMYWMLNFVASGEGIPQAVLIRGVAGYNGPGKLTRALGLDKSFYGENLQLSSRLWVEDSSIQTSVRCTTRIGIDYAGAEWTTKLWRWVAI